MKRDLFIIRSIRLKKTILFPTDLKLEILTIHEKMASTKFNDSTVYHRHELNVREDISLIVLHYKRNTSNNTFRLVVKC